MKGRGRLTSSLEDYLEAIWLLSRESKVVRVRDVARHLGVTPASVVSAVKVLARRRLVEHEPYGYISLTDRGVKQATQIYERHTILARFFRDILGLDSNSAEETACILEHHISEKALTRLVKFLEFVEECPDATPYWLKGLHHYMKTGKRSVICPLRGKQR